MSVRQWDTIEASTCQSDYRALVWQGLECKATLRLRGHSMHVWQWYFCMVIVVECTRTCKLYDMDGLVMCA